MIHDEPGHDLLQIEQAAAGTFSGYLGEWPHLKAALRRRGVHLLDWTPCVPEVRDVCKGLIEGKKP